jgi:PilZ domain
MPETLPAAEGGPRTAPPAVGERRRSPRRACRPAPAVCYVPWPDSLGRLGRAVDISPEGIGFLADRPLRPWSVLALQVLCGAPSASRTRVARVAHCAGGEEGGWRVGCEVTPPFSADEVASLL